MKELIRKAQINSLRIKAKKEEESRSEKRLWFQNIQIVEDPYIYDEYTVRLISKDSNDNSVLGSVFSQCVKLSDLKESILKVIYDLLHFHDSSSKNNERNIILAVSPLYANYIRDIINYIIIE